MVFYSSIISSSRNNSKFRRRRDRRRPPWCWSYRAENLRYHFLLMSVVRRVVGYCLSLPQQSHKPLVGRVLTHEEHLPSIVRIGVAVDGLGEDRFALREHLVVLGQRRAQLHPGDALAHHLRRLEQVAAAGFAQEVSAYQGEHRVCLLELSGDDLLGGRTGTDVVLGPDGDHSRVDECTRRRAEFLEMTLVSRAVDDENLEGALSMIHHLSIIMATPHLGNKSLYHNFAKMSI